MDKETARHLADINQSVASMCRFMGNHATAEHCDEQAQRILKEAEARDQHEAHREFIRYLNEAVTREEHYQKAKAKADEYGIDLDFDAIEGRR